MPRKPYRDNYKQYFKKTNVQERFEGLMYCLIRSVAGISYLAPQVLERDKDHELKELYKRVYEDLEHVCDNAQRIRNFFDGVKKAHGWPWETGTAQRSGRTWLVAFVLAALDSGLGARKKSSGETRTPEQLEEKVIWFIKHEVIGQCNYTHQVALDGALQNHRGFRTGTLIAQGEAPVKHAEAVPEEGTVDGIAPIETAVENSTPKDTEPGQNPTEIDEAAQGDDIA